MSGWSKGQPWRVVRSLDRLNAQIRSAYPRAVPPATDPRSWGSLADDAHASTSDHYPHYYRALGGTAVVCARDFPHAPALGLDAHALAERLRQSRDPRIGYLISNGRITGPAHGWRWDRYYGDDPHDTHIHMSTVHTAAADDDRDWQIGDDDMSWDQEIKLPRVDGVSYADPTKPADDTLGAIYAYVLQTRNQSNAQFAGMRAELTALRGVVETLAAAVKAGGGSVDTAAILAGVDERVARVRAEVADELAARLAG